MTPEQKEIKQLKRDVAELKRLLKLLAAGATIPHSTEQALRRRLELSKFARVGSTSKTAASETQAVNEAGAGSYNVSKAMDGFFTIELGDGTAVNVPYFS